MRHVHLTVVLTAALSAPAAAQTVRTWENPVSDNFAVSTRWNPNGKPTGTDTARFNQSGTYTINFTVNESFGDLEMAAGTVNWDSASARTVNVTSIDISNNNTIWRIRDDVRVTSSGVTTLNAFNGFLTIDGGRLTTSALQVSQGTIIGSNALSQLNVNGATNIGGQNLTGTVNLSFGTQATFGNTVNLAPGGSGSSSIGQLSVSSGATAALNGNFNVGTVGDDNRQGIVTVSGTNAALTQSGGFGMTIGRIQVGAPSGDNSSRIEVLTGGVVTTGTGAIQIQNLGHINVKTNGTFHANGALSIADQGQLNVSGGVYNANGTSTVNTGGQINHTGGTFNLNNNLIVNGGTFTQSAGVTFATTNAPDITVQAGGMYTTGLNYAVSPTSQTLVTGANSLLQTTGTITISGTSGTTQLALASGGATTGQALFIGVGTGNGSVFVDNVDSLLTATGAASSVHNGTLFVRSGSGALLGQTAVGATGATGTVNVQTAGTLTTGNLNIAGNNVASSNGQVNVSGANSLFNQQGAATLVLGGTTTGPGAITVSTGGTFVTGTGASLVNALGTITVNANSTFTNNGQMVVDGGLISSLAGTFNMNPGASLTLQNNALGNLGNFTFKAGSSIVVDNAELRLTTLTPQGGTANVLGGLVNFTQATSFTGGKLTALFGPIPTLLGGRTLLVQGTSTLQSQFTLDGGTFTTSGLAGGTLLNMRSGTLNLATGNLVVGNAGTFATQLTVGPGVNLNVQAGTSTVDAAAQLVMTGGQLNVSGNITNNGEIQLASAATRVNTTGGGSALSNNGLVMGTGRVNASTNNQALGTIRANTGDRLVFGGPTNTNAGTINLAGGAVEFVGALTNNTGGFVTGRGSLIGSTGSPGGVGVVNAGTLAFSAGTTDVFGDVQNNAGGRIVSSGGGVTTFYDDVVHNGAEIRTSAGGQTVFFGAASGSGPFTGTGTVQFEGDLRPGNSPARVTMDGSVGFGAMSRFHVELGGTAIGSQYDSVDVAGMAALDGIFDLDLINGFQPSVGQTFTAMTFGSRTGDFTYQDLNIGNGLMLVPSFTANSLVLTVSPVPEPGTLALGGMSAIAWVVYWRRRWHREPRTK